MYFFVYRDAGREWRWRLCTPNHRIIAESGEGYVRKADCLSAIELVRGSALAPIYEE